MAGITTAYCTSAKLEHLSAAHCFDTTVTPTGTTTSTDFTITSMSSNAGISVGNAISDTGHSGIPTGAVVVSIDSTTQITISKAATASNTGTALSVTGDVFKVALIQGTATGTYNATSTNYSDITGNSDEVSGTGYTTTGLALTNVGPVISSTGSYISFSPNPSWTSATFSSSGCMIYNTIARLGSGSAVGTGRAMGVFDFGGVQSVSAGTFTILMPAAALATAVFRIA